MNRIATNVIGAVIAIVVVFFLGRLFFLTGLQNEINQARLQLEDGQKNYETINAELTRIKPTLDDEAASTPKKQQRTDKMLKPGEESSLLRLVSETAGKSFRINSFDLIESFLLKPENPDDMGSSGGGFAAATTQELPELDDQGMPVGIATEDDEEWPGVEIVPLKLTFSTTFRTIGKFLTDAGQTLPLNSVRSLDLILRDEGLVKGTLVLNFPLAEVR
ncbi:MAG: hypothetical protein PHD82_00700 [Candidatus Riflebacteria bacterium]|nr:hypothetical protein [Candidatus Riflebacteria bacterium]